MAIGSPVGQLRLTFEPVPDAVAYEGILSCSPSYWIADTLTIAVDVPSDCVDEDGKVAGVVFAVDGNETILSTAWFEADAPTARTSREVMIGGWLPLLVHEVRVSPVPTMNIDLYKLPMTTMWLRDGQALGPWESYGVPEGKDTLVYRSIEAEGFADLVQLSVTRARPTILGVDSVEELSLRVQPADLASGLAIQGPVRGGPTAAFYDEQAGALEWVEEHAADPLDKPVMTVVRFGPWSIYGPPGLASPVRMHLHELAQYAGLFAHAIRWPSVGRVYVEGGEDVDFHKLLRTHGTEIKEGLLAQPGWTKVVVRRSLGGVLPF